MFRSESLFFQFQFQLVLFFISKFLCILHCLFLLEGDHHFEEAKLLLPLIIEGAHLINGDQGYGFGFRSFAELFSFQEP